MNFKLGETFKKLMKKYSITIVQEKPKIFVYELQANKFEKLKKIILNNTKSELENFKENYYKVYGLSYRKDITKYNKEQQLSMRSEMFFCDSMQFNLLTDLGKQIYDLMEFKLQPIRWKITFLNSEKSPLELEWHCDESVYELIKVIIPICSNFNFLFQLDCCRPIELREGFAYVFDSSIPHRLLLRKNEKNIRINLVLGFSPWFKLENETWIPNSYFKNVEPLRINIFE